MTARTRSWESLSSALTDPRSKGVLLPGGDCCGQAPVTFSYTVIVLFKVG
jgi:hypothetical protein